MAGLWPATTPAGENDVYDKGVLLREAAAVAQRGVDGRADVILMPISSSYMHFALNLLLNLNRLSYSHVLLLAADKRTCTSALALAPRPVRCVWDGRWVRDAELARRAAPWVSICGPRTCRSADDRCDCAHEPFASYRMWLSRWHATARLVAAGFDVLMLDLDIVLVDDVYAYFNSAPLDRYSLLFHSESLDDPFGNVQCGFVYARAERAPAGSEVGGGADGVGGGVAKAVAGFPLRALRFFDTAWERRHVAGGGTTAGAGPGANRSASLAERAGAAYFFFDQVHLVDVLQSQVGGRNTYRMLRGYDADNRKPTVREVGVAGADGSGSVAREALGGQPLAAEGARGGLTPQADGAVLDSHRVNELYRRYVHAKGGSREWRRRQLGGGGGEALPAGWAERFGLQGASQAGLGGEGAAAQAAIFEADLTEGWPADAADLPLEGGQPPLEPIAAGSLAALFLAQLRTDRAAGNDGAGGRPKAAAQRRELEVQPARVALLPTWLVSHWREGIKGGWGIDPPAAIAVHATNAVDKLLVLSAHGFFDSAAYAAAPGSLPHRLLLRRERVPLVAYAPSLSRGTPAPLEFGSVDEWRAATLQGLPAAALVSGRALVQPHVPCASPWLSRQRADGRAWGQRGCRTGLCGEWRVTAVGYVDQAEASARADLRAAHPAAAGGRARPLAANQSLTCDVHPNMAWPDGPVRKLFGYKCNLHAPFFDDSPMVGYTLSAWDGELYAASLGQAALPNPARNVAFAREAAERLAGRAPRGLLRVSEAELRAELARFAAEPIVWLGWPLNVTAPTEGEGKLAWRMRRFCERWFSAGKVEAKMPDLRPVEAADV